MSFLEALNEFTSNQEMQPNIIIFDVINNLLKEFITFKKMKNNNIPSIRFEELEDITYENLFKYGLKSVHLNSIDDNDAKSRISQLISQYYNKQYLEKNPHVQQLNDDVKEILHKLPTVFNLIGKSKLIHHKSINIPDTFSIEPYLNYDF